MSAAASFPDLSLDTWRGTRDTVHGYAKVLGKIRRAMAPPEKHWWHISLRATAAGLTTTPLPAGDRVVELILSFTDHRLHVVTNRGEHKEVLVTGQSSAVFCGSALDALAALGIAAPIDRDSFSDTNPGEYDDSAMTRFWRVLPQIDVALKRLKSEHRRESSPVQIWPHHFDLAVLLLTGRQVPGTDPQDAESADEQMNFGFTTGDSSVPEPYFYATAYPPPDGFTATKLPEGAYWHTHGWTGAALRYEMLRSMRHPADRLLEFYRAARDAGFRLMASKDSI